MSLLQKIETAMTTTGTRSATTDPLLDQYVWLSPGKLFEHQPTIRLDYNLGEPHRLSGSYAFIIARARPGLPEQRRRPLPGRAQLPPVHLDAAAHVVSRCAPRCRRAWSTSCGAASRLLRLLAASAPTSSNGPQTFEDQGGYAVDFDRTSA